jgi:hypothetical protein
MALDPARIKKSMRSVSNDNNKKTLIWKPKNKHVLRILPYKFDPSGYSFIELKFHYNIKDEKGFNRSFLSPDSFGRPDPIVEWSNRMKRAGGDDWKLGRQWEAKARTYVPIIVRGEEQLGVRFWGFGASVFKELLRIIDNPEYGDITDLQNGTDIEIVFKDKHETATKLPETKITVKRNSSPAIDAANKHIVENQVDILTLFPEPTYDELKEVFLKYIMPHEDAAEGTVNSVIDEEALEPVSPSAAASKSNSDHDADLDELFGNSK